jgi:TraM recognition site of TraD and TraG
MAFSWDLDAPLLRLSRQGDVTTIRQSFEHYHVFAMTGGGKTSAMKTLSAAMLRAGYGFLVLTTKPPDTEDWIEHCNAHGRGRDVVVFDESQGYNFIDHELYRQGAAGLGNVTECIMQIVEAADEVAGSSVGRASDEFWKQGVRRYINYSVPLLFAAWGKVTVESILTFVTSAATEPQGRQYTDPAFKATSFAARTLERAVNSPAVPRPGDELRKLLEFWFLEYTSTPDKTRGNLIASLTAKLDRFTHGRMKRGFCDRTTIVPEMCLAGGVIIMAMPLLTWNEDGLIGQILFKYMWQRTVEARNALAPELRERPLCLWMDEAQNFMHRDEHFLSTSRSSRTSVVAMSQSLPTYYSRRGADKTAEVDAFVGKCNTQIFMLNSCPRTNKWASELIGRGIQHRATRGQSVGTNRSRGMNEGANANTGTSSSHGSSSGGANSNSGTSSGAGENFGTNIGTGENEGRSWSTAETMDNLIEPNYFATGLRSGGPANRGLVDAIWFRAGGNYRGGITPNVIRVTFKQ